MNDLTVYLERINILEAKLELETLRRETAEYRLAHAQELATLKAEQLEQTKREYETARDAARNEYHKYHDVAYRNGETYREHYKAQYQEQLDLYKKECEGKASKIRDLEAALRLKDQELCELRGGCK